jgi:V/A-type H+-transporting ATPase subunit E
MEDVRSSEALEKEVLEDARKKAERILKNAGLQIESLKKEWTGKKEKEIALLDADAAAKKTLRKKEIDTAFPLETQRRKLKFQNSVFEEFLADFFRKLPAEDLARVLEEKGKRFAALLGSGGSGPRAAGMSITYAGISFETAQSIAVSLLGKEAPRPAEGRGFQGLVFTGEKDAYRYRLTVDEIAGELREYHRQPIMDALWKERN